MRSVTNLENMVELDFIFARAALAMEQNANEPIFNTEGKIHLRKARHPLINAKKSRSDLICRSAKISTF